MLLGELVPCGGGEIIPLLKSNIVVGRRPQADVRLRFKKVSGQHCELEFKEGYWYARDLNSRNGTKINGKRIESRYLMPGDQLMFAKHAYQIQFPLDSDASPPEEDDPLALSLLEKADLEAKRAKERRKAKAAKSARPKATNRLSARDEFLMEWIPER